MTENGFHSTSKTFTLCTKYEFSRTQTIPEIFHTHSFVKVPVALLRLLLEHRARLANTSKIKIRVQTQTGYILGMLMATFSPRRSLMFRVSVLKSHNKQPQTIFYICHSLNQLTKQQQHSSARNCDVKTVIPESRVSLVCHFVGHKHRSGGSPVRRWLRLRNCRIRTS